MIRMNELNDQWISGIRAVLFDMGDTLIDTEQIMSQSAIDAAMILTKNDFFSEIQDFVSTFRKVDQKFTDPHMNHLFSNMDIVRATVEELGLDRKAVISGAFLTFYRDAIRHRIVFDRILYDLIKFIKTSGRKVGIISDGTTIEQMEVLTRLGIIYLLDTIVISEQLGDEKPSAKIFQKAIADLGVSAQEVAVVGDSYERDIAGANLAGCRSILVQRFSSSKKISKIEESPDLTIQDITQLKQLFLDNNLALRNNHEIY